MVTTFSSLPVEIQRQCLNYLDTAALKSTRFVSRALSDIAAEALFGVATLRFTVQSANRFSGLLQHHVFRRYIRQINLETQWEDNKNPDDGCYVHPPPGWWRERAAEWTSARPPNLHTLVLDTAYACVNNHCSALGLAFNEFLSRGAMDSLTVKHLQDDCQVERPKLAHSSTKLHKLHLLITTWSNDASTDLDIEIRHRHALFNMYLSATWLEPLQSQLTHLTLHCNTYWGIYPRWQPNNLHFPNLKSLAFGKWTIAHDWQIDFITSHGPTLEQLVFTRCPIMHASRLTRRQVHNLWSERLPGTSRSGPPTTNHFSDLRWHAVLRQLASALPKLKHFSMGRGPIDRVDFYKRAHCADTGFADRYSQPPTIDWSRYVIFDSGDGPSEWREADAERGGRYAIAEWEDSRWPERENDADVKRRVRFPDCLQDDQDALEELLRTLRARWWNV
ncbi:uncharacterized protein M421DRAFT_277863 [Didymella exigua CBS 183.55]|uniref:F-box domain-containing protein n=1 Tax=Didymella exigua CBS 183.55 TaxID=1150837 RepID=A0A6A5RAF6_9PLEO|nr:uncharacterized protein M421DRAFT_277863 [Didymella exigua CBS 183.55]KAF1924602.1 hypothetical protein M421DRAFT_277863 [Didymella exigua CBS 183.55]